MNVIIGTCARDRSGFVYTHFPSCYTHHTLYNNIFPRFFLYENISVYNRSDCPARLKGKAIHFLSIFFWKFVCVFFFLFFSFELLLNEIVMDGCVHGDDGMSDLGMFCVYIYTMVEQT